MVGLLAPYANEELAASMARTGLSAMALELLPRISRAQSADALSSQANIAGYKSVLLASAALDRYFPMLMTAAGTVQPAKVVILGAGVAGLQAVATARRLGAVVYVSDIRPAVKEQVESLGARFIDPPELEDKPSESGGYAKQASDAFLAAQRQQLSDQLSEADVAICTAQVPGRRAPRLISEDMLDRMRPGAVVVDLAVAQGGNCADTVPGETVVRKGVKLIGGNDLPCSVPNHASALYARNLVALLEPTLKDGVLTLDTDDELIAGCLIAQDGTIRRGDVLHTRSQLMFVDFLWVLLLGSLLGLELIGKVPPTLHTPLMSGANAISGITVLAALTAIIKAGDNPVLLVLGSVSLGFALFNVIGGFLVTDRMLAMFSRKPARKENR